MSYDRHARLEELHNADPSVPDAIARALWAAAVSDDHDIANSRAAVYRLLETALEDALFHVFKLTAPEAHHARDLLSEYGPDDTLTGTTSRGIQGYAEFAILNPRKANW